MKITYVGKNSFAEEIGLLPDDDLVSINGSRIYDILDYYFHASDDMIELEIQRNGYSSFIEIEGCIEPGFGIQFEDMKCRHCGNKCVFCFIDQNPAGVRRSLLFKDEDYRMSFLYGNYVTLTNVRQKDLQRIAEQHLSPLYISIHAANPQVRQQLLRLKRDDRLFEKISFLAKNRITMHAQIVLCPGWNDGKILEETVDQCAEFFPWINTIAIVPVGLTKHRQNLPHLVPVDAEYAKTMLKWEREKSSYFKKRLDSYFIYLADEFYMLAAECIPPAKRYEDFAQIENGVGMLRQFLDDFNAEQSNLPFTVDDVYLLFVTGTMAAPVLERDILPVLREINGLNVSLLSVENTFFGTSVSVSGLLSGGDIARAVALFPKGDVVVLPPNCLNADQLFLDDWTIEKLQKKIGKPVIQFNGCFTELLESL